MIHTIKEFINGYFKVKELINKRMLYSYKIQWKVRACIFLWI